MKRIIIFFSILLVLAVTTASAHPGSGICVDPLGNIYFFDTGSGLWKIGTDGRLSHISIKKFHWLAFDAKLRFSQTRLPQGTDDRTGWQILKAENNPAILIASDWPITIDDYGNLCYQSGSAGNIEVVRTSPSGTTTLLAKLPATLSGQPLSHINGMSSGPEGSIYYTENGAVRRISNDGKVSSMAIVKPVDNGQFMPGIDRDSRPLLRGLAVDRSGVMYVTASGDGRLLKIAPDGKTTTLLQTKTPWSPTAVALFENDIYVLEYLFTARDVRADWIPRVRKITPDGKSVIIATIDQMPGAR